MSWFPAFKPGLWNAWILMLVYILHLLIMLVVDKAVGAGDIYKKMGDAPIDKWEKRDNYIAMVILFLLIVYSIFLPLKLSTAWFYAGLAIWLAGLVIFLTAILNVAMSPLGKVFKKGMVLFSRHPSVSLRVSDLFGSEYGFSFVGLHVAHGILHQPAEFLGRCGRAELP